MAGIQLNPGLQATVGPGRIPNPQRQTSAAQTVERSARIHSPEDSAAIPGSAILDNREAATLHMLFGSEKPQGNELYGQKQAAPVHIGHLVDIKG